MLIFFIVCLTGFGAIVSGLGCSGKAQRSPVSGQCDAYTECIDGVTTEQLCPDGLLFNDKAGEGYPCGYPIDVDCGPRSKIQNAQPTDECPRQFGYFSMGDSKNCGQFKNCASGRGFVFDCPDGLAWNKDTYKCDWPDQVDDCNAEAYLGFKCPDIKKSNLLGDAEYRFYPSPNSCQEYFVCIEGQPRKINCGEDYAFNEETNSCDDIENVKNCKGSNLKSKAHSKKVENLSAYSKQSSAKQQKATQNSVSQYRGNQKQSQSIFNQYGGNQKQSQSSFGQYRGNDKQTSSSSNQYRGNQKQTQSSIGQYRGSEKQTQSSNSFGQYRGNQKPTQNSFGQYRGSEKKTQSSSSSNQYRGNQKPTQSSFGQYQGNQKQTQSSFNNYNGNQKYNGRF